MNTSPINVAPSVENAIRVSPAQSRSLAFLQTLGRTGKHVYAGTVPADEVARRRRRNKAARAARRHNRAA